MRFSIWQGITLGTPGCTPFGIYYPNSPVSSLPLPSLNLNTTSRQVCEDQIEMSWPLGFFSITRHSPKATPPSKVIPHTLYPALYSDCSPGPGP